MAGKLLDFDYEMKYCRFCAQQKLGSELLDVNPSSQNYLEMEEKLSFLNVSYVDLTDNLPKNICIPCNKALNNAYRFFTTVKKSQVNLLSIFNNSVNTIKLKEENAVYIEVDSFDKAVSDTQNEIVKCEAESESHLIERSSKPQSKGFKNEEEDFIETYNGIPWFIEESSESETEEHGNIMWCDYKWSCSKCSYTVNEVALLRQHFRSTHNVCAAYRCTDCRLSVCKFKPFVEHVLEHRELLKFYCYYCNQRFDENIMSEHIRCHTENRITCEKCGQIFESERKFRSHNYKYNVIKRIRTKPVRPLAEWEIKDIVDKSWNGYPWRCQICGAKFENILELREHSKEQHERCFSMKCADCDEAMTSYRGLVEHAKKHRPFLTQYCHYCNYKFEDLETDNDHIASHAVVCQGCGEIFQKRIDQQYHFIRHNPPKANAFRRLKKERPVTEEDSTCQICYKVTASPQNLLNHLIIHTKKEKEYICETCGKAFLRETGLKNHILSHSVKEEVCRICKKIFNTRAKLKRHVLTHQLEKNYECADCGKRFRDKERLTQHLKSHSDTKPFKCRFCEKTFKIRLNMQTHEHQHTGARPYPCTDCDKAFVNWSNCNKHMIRRHGKTLAKSTLTSRGKIALNAKTGKPKKIRDSDKVKEWTQEILAPKRIKKIRTA